MKEIKTEILIEAPLEHVWQVLSEFSEYTQWNPFITKIEGNLQTGAKLKVTLHPPGKKTMVFKPVLLKVKENQEIRWLGHFLFPGIFDGEHIFILEKSGRMKTKFRHEEKMSGILVPILWKYLHHHVRSGFIEMNKTLKHRAESQNV